MSITTNTFLLFIDLETLGFHGPQRVTVDGVKTIVNGSEYYGILQAGFIVTDMDLNTLGTFETYIHQSDEMHARSDLDNYAFHEKTGFWKQYRAGLKMTTAEAESAMIDALYEIVGAIGDYHYDNGVRVLLAGKSAGFDKSFIQAQMPELAIKLGHQTIDVSVLKPFIYHRRTDKLKRLSVVESTHHVMDDNLSAIEECRVLKHLVDSIPDTHEYADQALGIDTPPNPEPMEPSLTA